MCALILYFTSDQIGRNPGLQAIWEDEKQRRREQSESSLIDVPESQGERHIQLHNVFADILMLLVYSPLKRKKKATFITYKQFTGLHLIQLYYI